MPTSNDNWKLSFCTSKVAKSVKSTVVTLIFFIYWHVFNNKQRWAISSQQITIPGLISIFRTNIYYFETDFCEDFCSLVVAIGQPSQKGTFYAIIIAAILSHPRWFFPNFCVFRCSVFRNDAVPVFRCSGVPGFTNSPFRKIVTKKIKSTVIETVTP
jgi:hypothetical protein